MGREYSSLPMFLYEVPVMPDVVLTVDLPLPRFGSGKVRETFDLGDRLLMVTTDRMSAFDVVMREGIPHKGEVLTRLSAFWFKQTSDIAANHLISIDPADFPAERVHAMTMRK